MPARTKAQASGLWAGSDVESRPVHDLYDKKTRHLDDVLIDVSAGSSTRHDARRTGQGDQRSPPTDGTVDPGLSDRCRSQAPPVRAFPPSCMPHGGPGRPRRMGVRLARASSSPTRGYVVMQPNFRGSTGYGNAWFQENGFKSWRTRDRRRERRRALAGEVRASPRRTSSRIVGWSYGGYAALQSAVLDPDLFKAIVAVAPVTDLAKLRDESTSMTNYTRLQAGRCGSSARDRISATWLAGAERRDRSRRRC